MMKTLLCIAIIFESSAFGSGPILKVQSAPHTRPSSAIAPNLIQGIVGIGQEPGDVGVPCISCFDAPAGVVMVPPAYLNVNPVSQPALVYYYAVVDTESMGGSGTSSVDLIESATGKVVQHLSSSITLAANSTNLLIYPVSAVPNSDGYQGAEVLVFTTTLGSSTVQGRAYLWMQ